MPVPCWAPVWESPSAVLMASSVWAAREATSAANWLVPPVLLRVWAAPPFGVASALGAGSGAAELNISIYLRSEMALS